MIRHLPKIALLVGALSLAGPAAAHGGGGVGPGVLGAVLGAAVVGAVVARPAPVVVEQPVYVAPQSVYVQAPPPPVYYQPAPVYVAPPPPPPGYYAPRAYYGPPRW